MGIKVRALTLSAALVVTTLLPVQLQAVAQVGSSEFFTVQQASGAPTVSLGGTVIPYKEVTLAAQIPGRVKYLAGIEGDTFIKGILLVKIDDSELLAKRNSAVAQYANAEAQLRSAGISYNRERWSPKSEQSTGGMGMPNLFDQMFTEGMEGFSGTRHRGVERRSDIYTSGIQITQARNSLMAARSQIEAIDAKLRDAQSVAPFAGVIMKKFIEEGDTMQPGQPLLVFADVEYLQILVDVPARLRPGLNEGMMLQAQLDVGNQVVPIRVAQIFPMADAQRHTVKVKFDLPQGISAPGMYAKVLLPDFTSPARSYPVIPTTAIRYNGSLPGVYVLRGDGMPELRLIRVGEKLEGGFTSVLSGLNEGERVLRNPGLGVARGWSSGPATGRK